jgi:methanogenic corrinoid protein MtbC1
MTDNPAIADRGRHPIQVVVGRTGLAADRIRQWERRYGVVSPERTEGGHRLYSDNDVERLRLLARVVEAGRRIGDVATLSGTALAGLAREDAEQSVPEPPPSEDSARGEVIESCMQRIARLDAAGLESLLRRSSATLGASRFVLAVVAPLLWRIGKDWEEGRIRPSHEHLASAVIRRVLGDLMGEAGGPSRHPTVVVATPQGAAHELGALMVAALASAEGWAVTYLGSDLPAADVAWIAEEAGAKAIALSIVHPEGDPGVARELARLHRAMPAGVTLLVGGRAAPSYSEVLEQFSGRHIDLAHFAESLRSIV